MAIEDVWNPVDIDDWTDGAKFMNPLEIHVRRIEVGPDMAVVLEVVHYDHMRQDWSLTAFLAQGAWDGPPWFWRGSDGPELPLDRRPYRFVVLGPNASWSDDTYFGVVWQARPEPGTWYFCIRNRSGSPDGNSYWFHLIERNNAI